ncbi:hypothetical protein EHS25_001645 [Saitozyma podzolica]|uniref:AB hydrolase-1 domain-containing protein n=1 Tax=Saitozyma podzolica TaxID=1890683 RepID=A0A427YGM6_9TREE|nr:hypothetical protein EHS25_001645 [Saitozyma podzolica]
MLHPLARVVHQRPLQCGIHIDRFSSGGTLRARRRGANVSTGAALASTSWQGSHSASLPPVGSGHDVYDPVELAYDLIEPVELRWSDQSMVVCHGLFGSKANWRGQARRLANLLGIPIYTVDMRNHGRSPHATPHTPLAMAHDVAAFLARRGLMSGVHLVGHSMGAKMAMTLALDQRLNLALRSLTVVDMAPSTEPIEPQ